MTQPMTTASPRAIRSEAATAPDPASPPGGAPPGESFADALVTAGLGPPATDARDDTRTADAEGAKAESDSPGPHDGSEPATPAAVSDAALALAAALAAVIPAQVQSAGVPAGGAEAPADPGGSTPVQTALAGREAAGPRALPDAPAGEPAATLDAPALDPGITEEAREGAAGPVRPPATPPASTAPGSAGAAPATAGQPAANHGAAPEATLAPAPAPGAPAASPAPVTRAADEPAAKTAPAPQPLPDDARVTPTQTVVPPVTSRVETAAPATPVAPPPPPARPPAAPVPLNELAHAAGAAIRFTASQGGGTARILLHPQELGSVEIRLRSTPDGITATLRTDNPQAAQTLAVASDELRRSLEAQGLSVLNLDVSDGSRRQAAHDDPEPSPRRHLGTQAGAGDDELEISGPARVPEAGSQIDVLA
jgi:flagellar hook-length control protein FliK